MDIYNVGNSENVKGSWCDLASDLQDYELERIPQENYQWVVYAYYLGSYEGTGELVALSNDGQLHYTHLGHCSCYGPIDTWDPHSCSVESYLQDAKCPINDKGVDEKVKELLQNAQNVLVSS